MLPLFYKFHKKKKKKCLHLVGEGDLCPSLLFSRLKLNDDSSNFGWRPRQHQLCGTARLYTWRNSFSPKKRVPQTQNTLRNPKRERRMKKPIHTNQRAPNLSFISLSALKKKKNSWFRPLPPHSSQVRIVGLQNNNKRQQQVLPLSCKRNTIAFGGTWARAQTLFWKTRRKRNRMMRGVNSEKCWLRDTEMLFPGVIICLSECPETSHT